MDNIVKTVQSAIGGLFTVLTSVVGLLVVAQVVFGEEAGMNVIGNLQEIVNGFVGEGASLAGLITLLLLVGLLQKQGCCSKTSK
jgi:predicted alternative tryptophan synthase beta-subunit